MQTGCMRYMAVVESPIRSLNYIKWKEIFYKKEWVHGP